MSMENRGGMPGGVVYSTSQISLIRLAADLLILGLLNNGARIGKFGSGLRPNLFGGWIGVGVEFDFSPDGLVGIGAGPHWPRWGGG